MFLSRNQAIRSREPQNFERERLREVSLRQTPENTAQTMSDVSLRTPTIRIEWYFGSQGYRGKPSAAFDPSGACLPLYDSGRGATSFRFGHIG